MSNRKVKTPDTGYIASMTPDGYGDVTINNMTEVACAFFQSFNKQHDLNADYTQTNAYAYLDVDNAYIKSLGYKLEGLYFMINSFGVDRWYSIENVNVAQRKLLTNEVNNVLVDLQVVANQEWVS